MQSFAKRLPESIGLQPFGWMDLATAFTNLITQTLGASVIAERARAELNHLVERMDLLPHHLRESLLHVEFPTDLAFRIELTSDLGAQIQLSPIAPPGPTAHGVQSEDVEPKAMKLLIPLLGPSGPEWIGLSLRHIAFSQIRAGQLFAIEVDADVDRFELLPLALSMTLAKEGTFTRPDDLQQRLSCRKMVALLAFPSGTPVLVPVFFDELSIQWMGLDGFGASGRWSFPAPKMAFAALMRLLAHVENAAMVRPGQFLRSLKLPEHVLLTLTTGPFWIRLPTYLGGGRVDIEQATAELDTPETLARFLRAVQQVDIDGFLETIPFAMGEHLLDLEIGSSFRTALRRWSTIAGPALIVSAWSALRDDGDALPSARIADKLRSRKGIFALGGATSEKYVAARLVGITSTGIEIVVILPLASAQPPVEHRFELRWSHLLASVMEVAEKMM
jgi:hypothetical protein